MKKDIVLCGVGGDGIVSVAKIISDAALNMGMNLVFIKSSPSR